MALVCGYYGLAVGCSGSVLSMPGQQVARFPKVRSFPTGEHYGFIWVWPGDPALADVALLPRFDWAERPGWSYVGGIYHVKCDYHLMIDNLMDLTHETYVHSTTVGQKEIDETGPETHLAGETVVMSRLMDAVPPPPLYENALRERGMPSEAVDRWQVSRFTLPSGSERKRWCPHSMDSGRRGSGGTGMVTRLWSRKGTTGNLQLLARRGGSPTSLNRPAPNSRALAVRAGRRVSIDRTCRGYA